MRKNRIYVLATLLFSVVLLAACGGTAATPTVAPTKGPAAQPAATSGPAAGAPTAAAPAAAPTQAQAQSATKFPTKPITFNIPWPAGGTTDIGGRIFAASLEKVLGQPVTIVNKPGASGQVGWAELALQKPDGYNIGMINLPLLNTAILDPSRKATFTIDSFDPIMNQVVDPGVLFVRPDSPYKSLKDIVEDAKKRPGEIKSGTSGYLSDDHLAILMLQKQAGIKLAPVHFDGDAPKLTALLGGHIDVAWLNVGGFVPQVKSGEVRAIAVLDRERNKFLPDVPTSVEQGYDQVINVVTRGVAAPKGLPADVRKTLEDAFVKAAQSPEHIQKMEDSGYVVKIQIGEEYLKAYREVHEQTKTLMPLAAQENK